MSKEYGKLLKKHVEGSTEFIRARMKLSESIMELASRNLVRWEQIATPPNQIPCYAYRITTCQPKAGFKHPPATARLKHTQLPSGCSQATGIAPSLFPRCLKQLVYCLSTTAIMLSIKTKTQRKAHEPVTDR
jgi:hypothetical protein